MTKPKADRAMCTLEFNIEAVRLVEAEQTMASASRSLGISDQTLFSWVKAHRQGKLTGADSKSAEQMGISRFSRRFESDQDGARYPGKSDGVLRESILLR